MTSFFAGGSRHRRLFPVATISPAVRPGAPNLIAPPHEQVAGRRCANMLLKAKEKVMKRIPVQGVHHITLVGSSRQTAIDFWQGLLGMPLIPLLAALRERGLLLA